MFSFLRPQLILGVVVILLFSFLLKANNTTYAATTIGVATTTLEVTNCGNSIVETGEECDVPGETGTYSTTIVGRQCTPICAFGPYCGDGILQTLFIEECDDGNNADGDFCGADCTIEPAGSGGGGTSGGGSSRSGGSSAKLGNTSISVKGLAYPKQTVNIILDAISVGSVRADSKGSFTFSKITEPGAASMGFWSKDLNGIRSVTFNTTFDVTQGAVTTVSDVLLPPTIAVDKTEINPGETLVFKGQTAPERKVQLYIDTDQVAETTSEVNGIWTINYITNGLSVAEHIAKVRFVEGSRTFSSESSFSTALTLFVGVNGRVVINSDLNRDGEVNLIDFSILIFWWKTTGGSSNPPADINGNGNVGIEDFSILLYNWTG